MRTTHRALARTLSTIERGDTATHGLRGGGSDPGSLRVGVTGPAGVGKSTLIDAMIAFWRRAGKTVAVLAIDPTGPTTGGALLGDRVRMERHSGDPGVYIRSMAARGDRGGVAPAAAAAVGALGRAGFAVVIIETIGAGQDQIGVAAIADTVVLVEAPQTGDEIQTLKAGLREMVDFIVVTRGDLPGAEAAYATLLQMLGEEQRRGVAAFLVSGRTGEGVAELCGAIESHGVTEDRLDRLEALVREAIKVAAAELALAQLDQGAIASLVNDLRSGADLRAITRDWILQRLHLTGTLPEHGARSPRSVPQ